MLNPFIPFDDRWKPHKSKEEIVFATVAEIYSDGATLYLKGSSVPSQKRYKSSNNLVLRPGNRVKAIRVSGTYIIDYIIGKPTKG